ncbi:MAG TPA: NTP transferase domain-containing protein [Solirubrobacteraceae bacterium]|nr:NTP transferase domain-containing protein [Solirubrobacteraceae bacterium]
MSNLPTGAAAAAEPAAGPEGRPPVGIVLAGGAGRRIGGGKAMVALDRRPLLSYPIEAVWRALGNVTIVAKFDTELPSVPGVTVWIEPSEPQHPLTGILHALSLAEGRPVLVCAGDMPLVTAELVSAIAGTNPGAAAAVVASTAAGLQPLLACYQPAALLRLAEAAQDPNVRLRDAVGALGPMCVEVEEPELLFNVNTPDDLLQAAAMLDRRRRLKRREGRT